MAFPGHTGGFNPRSPCGERRGSEISDEYKPFIVSIHAPRVGSDRKAWDRRGRFRVSIHAPRVGSDPAYSVPSGAMAVSIHAPRVGSDSRPPRDPQHGAVSIHAPRVGSDRSHLPGLCNIWRFNPRSPCGERRCFDTPNTVCRGVSIHAPRVGSDGIRRR